MRSVLIACGWLFLLTVFVSVCFVVSLWLGPKVDRFLSGDRAFGVFADEHAEIRGLPVAEPTRKVA